MDLILVGNDCQAEYSELEQGQSGRCSSRPVSDGHINSRRDEMLGRARRETQQAGRARLDS